MRLYNFEGRHGLVRGTSSSSSSSSSFTFSRNRGRRNKKESERRHNDSNRTSIMSGDGTNTCNETNDADVSSRLPYDSRTINDYFSTTLLMNMIQKGRWDQALRRCKVCPKEAKDWCVVTLNHSHIGEHQQTSSSNKETTKALPLHIALIHKAPLTLIKLLVQCYPKALRKKDSKYKRYPLHFACLYHASSQNTDALAMMELLHKGNVLAIRAMDSFGRYPLHYASFGSASLDVFEFLLKHFVGAATSRNEKHGWTPLHVAVKMALPFDILKLLVECAPSTIQQTTLRGANVYHIARHFHGRESVVEQQLWAIRSALDVCYDLKKQYLNLSLIADATLGSYMMQQQQHHHEIDNSATEEQEEETASISLLLQDNHVNNNNDDIEQDSVVDINNNIAEEQDAPSVEENDEYDLTTTSSVTMTLPRVETSLTLLTTASSFSNGSDSDEDISRSISSSIGNNDLNGEEEEEPYASLDEIDHQNSTSLRPENNVVVKLDNQENEEDKNSQEKEEDKNTNNENSQTLSSSTAVENQSALSILPLPATTTNAATETTSSSHESCCIICMDDVATHAFVPCGHLCACDECAVHLTLTHGKQLCHSNSKKYDNNAARQCPVCRKNAFMIMKVFAS